MTSLPIDLAVCVMPALNEEATIAATCASLGFGVAGARAGAEIALIIVDNGSTDRTLDVVSEVRGRSPAATVILGQESARGYVPPRHAGILLGLELSRRRAVRPERTLILQVDADTQYSDGYVEKLMEAARLAGGNVMLEGLSLRPLEFGLAFSGYIDLVNRADRPVLPLLVEQAWDILVDDKISAFRLNDYLRWGGLQREYLPSGEELHAETSRLYLKAHLGGARKEFVAGAYARPSQRRVLQEPVAHFASAGFPRAAGWDRWWSRDLDQDRMRVDFCHPDWDVAIAVRRAHQLTLQALIPLYAAGLAGERVPDKFGRFETFLRLFEDLTAELLAEEPGVLFARGLELLGSEAGILNLNRLHQDSEHRRGNET